VGQRGRGVEDVVVESGEERSRGKEHTKILWGGYDE